MKKHSLSIRDGNVNAFHPDLETQFICEFDANKTCLFNTPNDEYRIEIYASDCIIGVESKKTL